MRQVGSTFHAGLNVGRGTDFTLFAKVDGEVSYKTSGKRKTVSVIQS